MGNILSDYMSSRISDINLKKHQTVPGPVITLSRIAGCSTQQLAKSLATRLNKEMGTRKWSVLSKEILHKSANKLQLHPERIKSVFQIKDRSVLDDIAQTFMSTDYHLEHKMRKTVITVIKQFGVEGHKIILGRAGNTICADIEKSLHIRIDAPIKWRIERIMKSKNLNQTEALDYIEETERNRKSFRNSIKKEKHVSSEDFDLTFNQSKFSNDEMIEIIVNALAHKKII